MEPLESNYTLSNFWVFDIPENFPQKKLQQFFYEKTWRCLSEDELADAEYLYSIEAGDQIALKKNFTRGENLTVLSVFATGTVLYNPKNGRTLEVSWRPFLDKAREWFCPVFTSNQRVWQVEEDGGVNNALIDYLFSEKQYQSSQINLWQKNDGWILFYEAIANRLRNYKDRRNELAKIANSIANKFDAVDYFKTCNKEGKEIEINDICPFSIMGIFNRDMPDTTRRLIASHLAQALDVNLEPPISFFGIPILNQRHFTFFSLQSIPTQDIDALWDFFEAIHLYVDPSEPEDQTILINKFNNLVGRLHVGWNLTIALFWVYPNEFISLDAISQIYIQQGLGIDMDFAKGKSICSAEAYFSLLTDFKIKFKADDFPAHSFPELVELSWIFQNKIITSNPRASDFDTDPMSCLGAFNKEVAQQVETDLSSPTQEEELEDLNSDSDLASEVDPFESDEEKVASQESDADLSGELSDDTGLAIDLGNTDLPLNDEINFNVYEESLQSPLFTIDDIVKDGCFVEVDLLEMALERLTVKKNLILQGPPGTGKTWLGKRLAYALVGRKHKDCVKAVEFHSNMSYEDFIRGWRPNASGRLSLVDGPFLEMINVALANPRIPFIVLIEEVNRGNPSVILGEMLTLLEADKRNESHGLELCYRRFKGEAVFMPANLHVIATMNIADRSLATIDIALRRRFAFIDLSPTFNDAWRNWVNNKAQIDLAVLMDIEQRMKRLNLAIAEDKALGEQFCIGHSYVTPPEDLIVDKPYAWFKQVVETEISPLLHEYWFDDKDEAIKQIDILVEALPEDSTE